MNPRLGKLRPAGILAAGAAVVVLGGACSDIPGVDDLERELDPALVAEGKEIFRFDTFGDEAYWSDTLRMHEVVAAGVNPTTALAVGLKVDADALPDAVKAAIAAGQVDLNDPATTVTLLKLNAVVGLKGTVQSVSGQDRLVRLGVTCALCHSTVDDSFAPGIGRRLDGYPNRDLDVGAIVALSPAVPGSLKAVLQSWGPGKYDPRNNFDGKNTPLVLPPAFGLRGVAKETYTAEGPVSYWNGYVAVTQMHGQGSFTDERLGVSIVRSPDLVTPKLPALREYQLSLNAPVPPTGSFDPAAAGRGRVVFNGPATCASCHDPESSFTDVNSGRLHAAAETGMDPAYALRTTQKRYRTTPLKGLWQHPPYFHDGSAKTVEDVIAHYERVLRLSLSAQQKSDLAHYLRSL